MEVKGKTQHYTSKISFKKKVLIQSVNDHYHRATVGCGKLKVTSYSLLHILYVSDSQLELPAHKWAQENLNNLQNVFSM